jgi:putative addiction module component (TIGR02574 family)
LEQALSLPVDERAKLASGLLASLDDDGSLAADVEGLWAEESERRAAQVLAGDVDAVAWDSVTERIDQLRRSSSAE